MSETNQNQSKWLYAFLGVGVILLVAILVVMTGVAGKKGTETVVVIPPTPIPTNTPKPTMAVAPTTKPTKEAAKPVTPGKMDYKLADTDWKISDLNGYPYSSNDLDKAGISLKFIGRTTLSGFDGCGNYKTSYKENPEKGSLYVDPEILMEVVTPTPDKNGKTGEYCDNLNDEAKKARLEMFKRLPNVTKYKVDGTTLKLYDQNGTLVITARMTS